MLVFQINLPTAPPETVSGELTVTINGGDPIVTATTPEQTEVIRIEFQGMPGTLIEAALVHLDEADEPLAAPLTLCQRIKRNPPQPTPGEFCMTIEGELP